MYIIIFTVILQVSLSRAALDVQTEGAWADEGSQHSVTCKPSEAISFIHWFKGGLSPSQQILQLYIPTGIVSDYNQARYSFDKSTDNYPLTVNSVGLDDEDVYWCKVQLDSGAPDVENRTSFEVRIPVVNTTMNISNNGSTFTGNEGNTDIPAGTKDEPFNCTASGIKPGATVFVWTLDDTPKPSTGPPTQSPNGADNRLTDSTSTLILNITDDFSKPLRLCCATTNRQDGSSETEASICVTLNLIDPCQNNPCQNDGTCTNWNGMPNCTCTDQFTGVICTDKDGAGSILYRLDVMLACFALTAVYMFNHGI